MEACWRDLGYTGTEGNPWSSFEQGRAFVKEPEKGSDISKGVENRVAADLIDFSDREDEFLSSEVKQQALSFAIISSVVGFVLSSWLFVHHKVGPASEVLDRRAAEAVRSAKSVSPVADGSVGRGFFQAPRVESFRREKRVQRPVWKEARSLVAFASEKSPEESDEARRKRVLETSLGIVPEYRKSERPRRASSRPVTSPSRAEKEPDSDPSRLLFPQNLNRPSPGTLSEVESQVAGNLVVLSNGRDEYHPALVLDSRGRALVSAAFARPDFLGRVWVNGQLQSARLLATDREFGLSLIQLAGGGPFQNLPLAPVPPSTGDLVLGFALSGRSARGQTLRAGMPFGRAGFYLDGRIDRQCFGTALFNDRGELAGCYVSALPGAPGSGIHLAVDVSTIYRLMRGYKGGNDDFSVTEEEAVRTLRTSVLGSDAADQAKRGRIIPGVGLSDFYLGMTQEEARKWASPPRVTKFGGGFTLWDCPAPPVSLYFAGDTLLAASTSNIGFSTLEGLAVGADVDAGDLRKLPAALVSDDLVSVPGMEILMDASQRIGSFVVKPRYSNG